MKTTSVHLRVLPLACLLLLSLTLSFQFSRYNHSQNQQQIKLESNFNTAAIHLAIKLDVKCFGFEFQKRNKTNEVLTGRLSNIDSSDAKISGKKGIFLCHCTLQACVDPLSS